MPGVGLLAAIRNVVLFDAGRLASRPEGMLLCSFNIYVSSVSFRFVSVVRCFFALAGFPSSSWTVMCC